MRRRPGPSRRVRLRDRLSLRVQLVGVTAVLAGLVAIGLVGVVQIVLAGASNDAVARVLQDRANALVDGIEATSPGTVIQVPRKQLGPGVAVFDGHGNQVAGTVPPSLMSEFTTLAASTHERTIGGGEQYAILAKPFVTPAGTRGVAIMTEPGAPYERDEQAALVVSLVGGALLVLVAAGSAAWISRRVLSPVGHMATTAEEWSEHDLERRFGLGQPTNEIRALGHTLDGLLDKVAHVILSEQRLTSELAHELRTPLTAVQGLTELLAARDDLAEEAREDVATIHAACGTMANTITVLLDLARQNGSVDRDRTSLAALRSALQAMPRRPGEMCVDLGEPFVLDVPDRVAVRALAPVIDNALSHSARIQIGARAQGRHIEILVADHGPGIGADQAEHLFTPGWSVGGGSGLGLSLARRIARTSGGDVTLREAHNAHGGATFAVAFPGTTRSGR